QVQRLADDHANAQWLGDALRSAGFEVEPVQTNMVYVQIGAQAQALKAFAAERGIKLSAAPRLRMVTHLDVSRAQIEQVLETFVEFSRK
ncbi:MAG: low-specificity L-threonine aldolase, partial [Pseudomonas sp.]